MGTATTQVLRWRTDVASDSRVRLGTSPANLVPVADDAAATTEHAVTLTGLAPDTVYYYSVGTSAGPLAGGDVGHFFVTPPAPGTADAVRVWVLGDAGTAGPTGFSADQAAVRDAYTAWNTAVHRPDPDAGRQRVLLRHRCRIPERGIRHVRQHCCARPTSGRPSAITTPTSRPIRTWRRRPISTSSRCPRRARRAAWRPAPEILLVRFRQHPLRLPRLDDLGPLGERPDADVARQATSPPTRSRGSIAFWHHPPYTKGSHDSDAERRADRDARERAADPRGVRRRPGAGRAQPFLRTLQADRRPLRTVVDAREQP